MSCRSLAVSAIFLAVFPLAASALEDVDDVTRERAAELGIIVRAKAAGPDAVGVELEFPTSGELKGFRRVEFRIEDGKKLIVASTLKEEESQPGHVVVSFYADRGRIPQIELKVVTVGDALSRVGHVLALKDFVDLEKLR
jgi:hypothetical protein